MAQRKKHGQLDAVHQREQYWLVLDRLLDILADQIVQRLMESPATLSAGALPRTAPNTGAHGPCGTIHSRR